MTENEYAERLEQYRLQIERLIEMGEARDARYQSMKIDLEALRVKYDYLEQKFLRLLAMQSNKP